MDKFKLIDQGLTFIIINKEHGDVWFETHISEGSYNTTDIPESDDDWKMICQLRKAYEDDPMILSFNQ